MVNKELKELYSNYGEDVFSDEEMKKRLSDDTYKALRNTMENGGGLAFEIAGEVANAMMEWAMEKGATHFVHWFQPMNGSTAEKRNTFLTPDKLDANPILTFSAKALIRGEADGSAFPSGGLRATFEARGYTIWDCTSPAFIKRNPDGPVCLCIPTAYCSFSGEALDEKTPLLRSMDALNKSALRILRLLGDDKTMHVTPTVGAEQEYFLIKKEAFLKRKDLAYTGRTLFGAPPAKGQEMYDHYYASTPEDVMSYMNELNRELWRMGVPCKTEHNEAAPAQYEQAQLYVSANLAVDQNQLVMEMMRRVADRHGMTCLLHEKPFQAVNGSGKHNNWSLITNDGRNLLKQPKTKDNRIFYTFMMAVISAVDEYADALRLSCANSGNECRLGGYEAPPQIISVFLGPELTSELEHIANGGDLESIPSKTFNIGVSTTTNIKQDLSDRNRTSPFAFTGDKFEFRMVGSSQSLGLPNTVLNTITAEYLDRIADELEQAEDVNKTWGEVMRNLYQNHARIIFNGNNYDSSWTNEAKRRGLKNIENTVDAIGVYKDKEMESLFEKHSVFSRDEMNARAEIAYQNYATAGMIEATTMGKMTKQTILPAVVKYAAVLAESAEKSVAIGIEAPAQTAMLRELNRCMNECRTAVDALDSATAKIGKNESSYAQAVNIRDRIRPRMAQLRQAVDKLECIVGKEFWPLPSYGEMLFRIDRH